VGRRESVVVLQTLAALEKSQVKCASLASVKARRTLGSAFRRTREVESRNNGELSITCGVDVEVLNRLHASTTRLQPVDAQPDALSRVKREIHGWV
jgi:hypothetical protein